MANDNDKKLTIKTILMINTCYL